MKNLQAECPVTYFEKNMLFNTLGSCWAVYKLAGFNYDFKSNDAKIDALIHQINLLKEITAAKILIVPTVEPVDVHASKIRRDILAKNKSDPLADSAGSFLDQTCQYLNRQDNENWKDHTCFVLVKLQPSSENLLDLALGELWGAVMHPLYTATVMLGLTDNEIPAAKYRRFAKLEQDSYTTLKKCMELKRVSSSETQWLLKRTAYRGTGVAPQLNRTVKTSIDNGRWHREYTTDWTPALELGKLGTVEYYRPNKPDIANLFEGNISANGSKGVRVRHADGTVSYQSYVVLTGIPDKADFPGCEWIYNLQRLPISLEMCIDIENTSSKSAQNALNKKGTEINTQYENVMEANAQMPRTLDEAQAQLEGLKAELEKNKLPMSSVRVSICVSGSDEQSVDDDVKDLISTLADMDFTAVRPIADQIKLYYQHIPGTESFALAFTRKLSPFMVGGGIFGASNSVGDDVGYYIGYANGKPVWLRLGHACLSDSSPAGVFYGGLGQGKSLNANLLLFVHVLFGACGLVICPKGERAHWQSMPILGKYVNIVEFSPQPKNKGKLDPYNIFRGDINEATALATTVLMELLRINEGSDEYIVLLECLDRVRQLELPSMEAAVAELDKVSRDDIYYNAAQKLQRTLMTLKRSGLVQLFFGNGSEQAIDINGRLNVIMLNGINLPDRDTAKENYGQQERQASLLISVVASISKKFAHLHPGREKITLIDESWALTATTAGCSLIDYHCRMGRSLYHVLLLNGHSVRDLPNENLRGTITYKFCFNPKDKQEAMRMLEFMRLDQTEDNAATLLSLRPGECLFNDLYGRVALLHFDPVFEDIFTFFKTTPKPDDDSRAAAPVVDLQPSPNAPPVQVDDELGYELEQRINRLLENSA